MSATALAGQVAARKQLLRVKCETTGLGRECRIMDLSPSGAFIESFVPPVTGSKVTLQFRLPNGHMVCAAGLVKYHQFKIGFGLEFTELSSSDQTQIAGFVAC
jgi:hypothetical protein